MLYEFLDANRDKILRRSRSKLASRQVPTPTEHELAQGLPIFLDQLIAILRVERGARGEGQRDVSASAARHGAELLRSGLTVGQVVHDYGSICQSVTEVANEDNVAITAEEFQTFNGCLDDAIAQAVTEYEHQRDRAVDRSGVAHLGVLAHEMRNLLMTAMLTFDALKRGGVGVKGSTGTLHGRSLSRMRTLIDRTLAEVRLGAAIQRPERFSVAELMEEIEIVATVETNDRGVHLSVEAGPYDLDVHADRQILVSAVANLVQNAFKFSRAGGHVSIRAHSIGERVLIEVKDECGGLPPGSTEDLFRPFEQKGLDQTGLGLGLAISAKGVRASGGDIRVRDLPGSGCVFTVDLPRAPPPD
ncbi:MAG TPA: HAMP domain-containing sensor histidine kinase [Polyangia bacterium]|nr:HAMP domain-containing sensor histidine kinase [Polyangia bacterium]